MKIAVIAALGAGLASPTLAAERVSDLDYLKAARCKGLATTLAPAEAEGFAAFLKAQRNGRPAYVPERGESETDRALREAKSEDRRARLTAELSGPCQVYVGGGATVATRGGADVSKQ